MEDNAAPASLEEIAFVNYADIPLPLPISPLYEPRHSPIAGRGVFATRDIPNGTMIFPASVGVASDDESGSYLSSSETLLPLAHTILREYRKEVCGECFAYDRGREWKVKLEHSQSGPAEGKTRETRPAGIIFCTVECRSAWLARYGNAGTDAFAALEDAVRKSVKRAQSQTTKATDQEQNDSSIRAIQTAWNGAEKQAIAILAARGTDVPSKADRKLLRVAGEQCTIDGDLCYYLLTGVLNAYRSSQIRKTEKKPGGPEHEQTTGDSYSPMETGEVVAKRASQLFDTVRTVSENSLKADHLNDVVISKPRYDADLRHPTDWSPKSLLPSLFTLAPDPTCYDHPSSTLDLYTSSYLLLHTLLPPELLPFLTPSLAHELNSRASHNAFSIRPSEQSDGGQSGEFTGWGVWPAASFFNHSCTPNVGKRRKGRIWEFFVDEKMNEDSGSSAARRFVQKDDELCITYLGGDENDLSVSERRMRLQKGWGFQCMCKRCVKEANSSTTM